MRQLRRFETLEKRCLFSADFGGVASQDFASLSGEFTPAEVRSVEETAFLTSLETSLAWDENSAFSFGDSIVVPTNRSVLIFARDPSSENGLELTGELHVDGGVYGVVTYGDRLVIASQFVSDFGTIERGTVRLASIDDQGRVIVEEEHSRSARLSGINVVNEALVVSWRVDSTVPGSQQEFASTPAFVDDTRDGLVFGTDVFFNGSLDAPATVVTEGQSLSIGDGVVVVDDGVSLYLFSNASDGIPSQVTRPDGLSSRVAGIAFGESGSIIVSGNFRVGSTVGFGAATILADGSVEYSEVETDANQSRLALQEAQIGGFFNNGLSQSVTVYKSGSASLSIVTNSGDALSEQVVQLPYSRIGFRPAFVLNDDTIVAIRADIGPILAAPNVVLSEARPELFAYLLTRNGMGEFEVVESRSLGDFDFRSAANAQHDGSVTLNNGDEALVLRVSGVAASARLSTQRFSTGSSGRVTGFAFGSVQVNDSIYHNLNLAPSQTEVLFIAGNRSVSGAGFDVNGDGRVSALDALMIINELSGRSSQGRIVAGSELTGTSSLDANGDGYVTALDALMVINHLGFTATSTPNVNVLAVTVYSHDDDEHFGLLF